MIAPSLADLLDLERMGVCKSNYENNIHSYQVINPDNEEFINYAMSNTALVLSNGAEAITDMLLTIEGNCDEELDSNAKYNSLWLLKELIQALRAVNEQELMLKSAATASACGQSKITKLKQQA